MAEVAVYYASMQLGDGNKGSKASATFRISAADFQAYAAAADTAARAATNAGLLLAAALAITRAAGQTYKKKFSVAADFVDTAYVPPTVDLAVYNSNLWKVTFNTTNAGIPAVDTLYVPQYLITGVVMESNGISADLTDSPVSVFVSNLIAHGLSKYGTAITSVISIERNDN